LQHRDGTHYQVFSEHCKLTTLVRFLRNAGFVTKVSRNKQVKNVFRDDYSKARIRHC